MVFQKGDITKLENRNTNIKVNEVYELIDGDKIFGYATINDDKELPVYIYVKKEYRGNRIRKSIV